MEQSVDMADDVDQRDFLTTLGREFAMVLESEAGITGASIHDCYDAVADALGAWPTRASLRSLPANQVAHLAKALNARFETTTVQPSHIESAVAATLWHWT
jgi:hypothetical protein